MKRKSEPENASAVDINKALKNEHFMLEKSLTQRIQLSLNLQQNLWPVWLDVNEFEDMILNLSINSMHSIHEIGQIVITTLNVILTDSKAQSLQLEKGGYVKLTFRDSGCGIKLDVLEKVFDPFFTTKGSKGTGLGLSQIYAFIRRCGGTINIQSELGQFTEITLLLPKFEQVNKTLVMHQADDNSDPMTTTLIVDGQQSVDAIKDKLALKVSSQLET